MSQLRDAWAKTEEGKEYVEMSSVAAARPSGSAGPSGSASTPAELTPAQAERKLKGYFKTHVFHTYGGLLWLKFLVATGNVDAEAVDAVNGICSSRSLDRRGALPTNVPDATPGNIFLRRSDRASTPVPAGFMSNRSRRAATERKLYELMLKEARDRSVDSSDDDAREAAEEELRAAEADTRASGFAFRDYNGTWHNRFASTQAGLFEMALKAVLEAWDFGKTEIKELTREEEEPEGQAKKSKGKKGKGGKGKGKGGGWQGGASWWHGGGWHGGRWQQGGGSSSSSWGGKGKDEGK